MWTINCADTRWYHVERRESEMFALDSFTSLVILDKGTVDHSRYIKDVLPVALKYENEVFGNNEMVQMHTDTKMMSE